VSAIIMAIMVMATKNDNMAATIIASMMANEEGKW